MVEQLSVEGTRINQIEQSQILRTDPESIEVDIPIPSQ